MKRYILHILTVLLLLLTGLPTASGQGYFTITNGHYYWFDGLESDVDDSKYLTAWDEANGWKGIYRLGTHASFTPTEIVKQGDTYLALDISDPSDPKIANLPTDNGFTQYCVWYRTGNTGHYYQEWDGYRYYLIASHSSGLSIYKVAVGQPLQEQTSWNDWDHGCAIQEETDIPGGKKTSYYWLMYDNLNDANGEPATNPAWRMSTVSCYQRPDEMILKNYHADGAGGNTWNNATDPDRGISYYDNVRVGGQLNYPAGIAATFMNVQKDDHAVKITHLSSTQGLQSVTPSRTTIGYGENIDITAAIVTNTSNQIEATYTPAYTEYTEETYRRGINLSSNDRTENTFGSAGIPTTRKWYFYNNARYNDPPQQQSAPTTIDHVEFDVNPQARRFLSLGEVTLVPDDGIVNNFHVTLNCYDIPMMPVTATITATVFYANSTTQELSTTITVEYSKQPGTMHSTKAPAIKGSVFGGGKMANVTGNTNVTVHSADSIYAVYGGNDIAGWVQGEDGATIQIGTTQTNEDHPVRIGWVYGGGCGYYTYSGVYDANNPTADRTLATRLGYGQYCFNGNVYKWNTTTANIHADSLVVDPEKYDFEYTPYSGADFADRENGTLGLQSGKIGGTIPYVKTAHINIGVPEVSGHSDSLGHNAHEHNDHILIDSLFGGAENAFIGMTATNTENLANAITLNINGGTILSVFGGNNYGGAVAQTSRTLLTVNCTKLTDNANLENSYFHGAGRDYGIRNLFGGGNMVNSTHVQLTFHGGQVDTAFVGGNSATVANPMGTVEAVRDGVVYDYQGIAQGQDGFTKPFMNGHFIYTNPTLTDTSVAGRSKTQGYTDANGFHGYTPDIGLYNVRFLFGGNNKADMENVSFVQLHSGGVLGVYGGGNMGDMANDKLIATAMAGHVPYFGTGINELVVTLNDIMDESKLISVPPKISAVIAANEHSQIIVDYVHGGCRRANVKNSCGVYLAGGSYFDVFAGNDVSGDIGSMTDGATYCFITGDAVVHNNVYGGSDGYYHCEARDADGSFNGHYAEGKMGMGQFNDDVDYDPFGEMVGLLLPTLQHSNIFVNGGLIKGDLVAGGVMANVGYPNIERNPGYKHGNDPETTMNVNKNMGTVRLEIAGNAEIRGNVFGGGAFASVYGLSQVYIHGTPTLLRSLYAGNDCLGHVETFLPYQSDLENDRLPNSYFRYYFDVLHKNETLSIPHVASTDDWEGRHQDSLKYMNNNLPTGETWKLQAESANRAAQKSSNGDPLNFYVNTDDNGIDQYNPKYSTYVLIEDSPIINSVYGSGNGAWNYDGTMPQFPSVYICDGKEGDRPNQKSAFIDIHTSGGFIDTVFGGGNGCTVTEELVVLLNNKTQDNTNYNTNYPAAIAEDPMFSHFAGGTKQSGMVGHNFVGTIFGGNNFSDMASVPEIKLVKGNVKNIYGGGNEGNMRGSVTKYDICGNKVNGVSTHVVSNTENVTVTDTVFGGCRMSDIKGTAFVQVNKTSDDGIHILYGGNDISGNVGGNTRIDMAGGIVNRIYGGSNGQYDYVPVGYGEYNVYNYGQYNESHPEQGIITTAGRPDVDSTHINLWGGKMMTSVFAGGSMANTRSTCLVVNDEIGCEGTGHVTVKGTLFGGGEGRWDDLNARDLEGNRWGNVTGTTHVHLYHADDVTSATAYGGGGGGDVQNTFIKTYDSWNSRFEALFGGCWGSEVFGTARLEFNGVELVKNLFGGNDFTGNVYRTEILVNSGRFFNVYGGGNGDYPDNYYTSQHANALLPEYSYLHASENAYAGNKSIDRPNSEYVHITFNDGEVDSCLYGGGKMGTILPYKKNPTTGEYVYDARGRYQPDTMRVATLNNRHDDDHMVLTVADPADFAYTVLNIHGGYFHRNVFAGGRGFKNNKKPIVYGVKVVNMDGGEIYESLYGGSEFVNDGYPAETWPHDNEGHTITGAQRANNTSKRPSSIVNITGGTVGSNLYGAGYQGIVYGSTYVNIGQKAIDSCTVWKNSYGTADYDSTYIMFKPGFDGNLKLGENNIQRVKSQSDALKTNKLQLKASVYSGANWGLASGQVTFDNPGFVGGESRLYVDGEGYNTTNDPITSDPEMNLMRSLYGSGTSVLGGDLHSNVEVRNYGGMKNCHPTKTLETIQRTDSLWLHNTAIIFKGSTDASQQYMSNRYSLKNIEYWNYRGYNVSELQAMVDNVENLAFYEQSSVGAERHTSNVFVRPNYIEVPLDELNIKVTNNNHKSCGDNVEICSKEYMVDPTDATMRHTLLILDNGVDLTIGKSEANSTSITYGSVTGYGYVVTPGGYQSTITARPKMELTAGHNMNDGGFVTNCDTCNRTRTQATTFTQVNTNWTNRDATYAATDELKYTNHATADAAGYVGDKKYREWKAGDRHGLRETEATLLAHTNPKELKQDWSMDITSGASPNTAKHKFGVAEAVFEMPATTAGHYYQLIGEGFVMTGSNGEIELVDSAWHPTLDGMVANGGNLNMANALSNINNWYTTGNLDPDNKGEWVHIPNGNANEMEGSAQIRQAPEYTFGLIMVPNNNFATTEVSTGVYEYVMPASIDHDQNPTNDNVAPGQDWANFIINGNARVNSVSHYCSPKVFDAHDASNPELKPSMRLYLTYDTSFSTTFNGSVSFKMMEYDENGREVAPIRVTIFIQTIIDELKNVEQDVLAMYNAGRTNTFTRKLELVPCGEERNLYITGIRWMPTDHNGEVLGAAACSTDFNKSDRFSLLGDTALVRVVDEVNYPHSVGSDHLTGTGNHSSHNRFALAITPTNNVSEDVSMANGWIRGVGDRINVYKLAYPSSNGAAPVKTLQWQDNDGDENDSVAKVSLKDANGNGSQGYFVGTMDGRGSAMLDVELTFDGSRVYDKIDGKGYVGKVILTMETFTEEGNESRGTFNVTIYVKTREHGDTIYIASANSVTRCVDNNNCITLYPFSNVTQHGSLGSNYQKSDIGKTPGMYVQSFHKALESGIYQEGDVIAVIDKVTINNEDVHITGPNGPPIEVIRYDGHHHELPDEQSVYRGTMIEVSNGGSFVAQNIAFHGGGGAHIKHIKRQGDGAEYDQTHLGNNAALDANDKLQFWDYTYGTAPNTKTIDKLPDTNMAYGPIIQAKGTGTTVNLREGTIVHYNWNGYGSAAGQTDATTGMPTSTANMGAISVTNGATLTLNGNVTVENNFSHTMSGLDRDLATDSVVSVQKSPGGAAIYVDGGTMELAESNRRTAVTITNNYLMDPHVHDINSTTKWWTEQNSADGVPERWVINTNVTEGTAAIGNSPATPGYKHANVLLTRKANTTQSGYTFKTMNDAQSDVILVSGTVGDKTKIGVRKWFPGEKIRDTIRFATVTGGNNTLLDIAVNDKENFQSDDGFRVFYNSAVDLTTGYLFRCATFRHQYYIAEEGEDQHLYVDPVYNYNHNLTLKSGNVLHFGVKENLCPSGGDSIIYRVQGGMMPYTYTWSDPDQTVTLQKTVTPHTDAQVWYDIENTDGQIKRSDYATDAEFYAARAAKYAASIADTLLLPYEPVRGSDKWSHLLVSVKDATGECELHKYVDIRVMIDHSTTNPLTYVDNNQYFINNAGVVTVTGDWRATPVGDGWTDTATVALNAKHAVASRNYKGVQITPRVWVDRSVGTISAVVENDKNDYVYQWTASEEGDTVHELSTVSLCPGDTIYLYTEPRTTTPKPEFIMWDFDPYYKQLASYIVPPRDETVTAYYGPGGTIKYWHEAINTAAKAGAVYDDNYTYTTRPTLGDEVYTSTDGSHKAGMVTTYNGDVHIYDENGLAWLISCVNGLNNTQARTFHFNRVLIHPKAGGYDMSKYLWTPLGTEQHPFMGRLFGVSSTDNDDIPWSGFDANNDTMWHTCVPIMNIIVNEPNMYSAGFIGHMDSAGICNIALTGALIRGSQYVGGLAGISSNSYVKNSAVKSDIEDADLNNGFSPEQIPTTILTTHYVSGGMLGKSTKDRVTYSEVATKFVGDAVYSGGGIGYGYGSTIQNVTGHNFTRLEGMYLGGIAGYLQAAETQQTTTGLFRRAKSTVVPSKVQNNYCLMQSDGRSQFVGGVVGYAENTIMENNYVYGTLDGQRYTAGVGAGLGEGSNASKNYYAKGAATSDVGFNNGATTSDITDFEGSGNQINISEAVYGVHNLTRVLNLWVLKHNAEGGNFLTWRSDLEGANSGYPMFGQPDIIPVSSEVTIEGCDSLKFHGRTFTENGTLTTNVVDSLLLIDSTANINIVIHHTVYTSLSDSADVTVGYEGYGFTVTPAEVTLLRATIQAEGSARLILYDTLQTEYGCDSIVSLMLIFTGGTGIEEVEVTNADIKVYPNPTLGEVTIEAEQMSHVELYDTEGRRLQDYYANSDKLHINLNHLSTGMYYLRIHTPNGVTIQKVVKK